MEHNIYTDMKTVRKRFDLTLFEEEQAFLADMHRQGWRFVNKELHGWFPSTYYFVPCQQEEVVYQIDYQPKGEAGYFRMFSDCGWELCYAEKGTVIFRKPKRLMNGNEEIYCDPASKLAFMKKMVRRVLWLAITWMLLAACWVIRTLYVLPERLTFIDLLILIGYSAVFFLYVIVTIQTIVKYRRFKKKLFDSDTDFKAPTPHKGLPKPLVIIISLLLTISIMTVLGYAAHYQYWSRRHQLIYKVECIQLTPINEYDYEMHIKGSAKQWLIDRESHTFKFGEDVWIHGDPQYWIEDIQMDYITIGPGVSADFEVTGRVVLGYGKEPAGDFEELKGLLTQTDLVPVDENGNWIENANFYFDDYRSKIELIE